MLLVTLPSSPTPPQGKAEVVSFTALFNLEPPGAPTSHLSQALGDRDKENLSRDFDEAISLLDLLEQWFSNRGSPEQ